MLVVGANTIKDGLSPVTGLLSCRGPAVLGPVPTTQDVDPISRVFVLIGKMIATERLIVTIGDATGMVEHIKAVGMGLIGQNAEHTAEAFDQHTLLWSPALQTLAGHIPELNQHVTWLRSATKKILADESTRILDLDPQLSLAEKVDAVIEYMNLNGLTVAASQEGFRDYLASVFTSADGTVATFPMSERPSFPDRWITNQVVDPKEKAVQSWIMIL